MYDLLVRNGKLVTPDRIYEADIAIQDGKYAAFLAKGTEAEAKEVIDAKGGYVFPGIIDCHAHLNEPGFEYREDFETGSRAAVVAGCTCLIDMPLNNDPFLYRCRWTASMLPAGNSHNKIHSIPQHYWERNS